MRSSSIKSLVVTVSVVIAVSTLAPTASARPVKAPVDGPSAIGSIGESADRAFRAMKRLVIRFFGPSANTEISIPLPTTAPTSVTTTATPTLLEND